MRITKTARQDNFLNSMKKHLKLNSSRVTEYLVQNMSLTSTLSAMMHTQATERYTACCLRYPNMARALYFQSANYFFSTDRYLSALISCSSRLELFNNFAYLGSRITTRQYVIEKTALLIAKVRAAFAGLQHL